MKKTTNQKTNLVISADHGGYELKENLKKFLARKYPELNVIDVGAFEFDAEDDLTPIPIYGQKCKRLY